MIDALGGDYSLDSLFREVSQHQTNTPYQNYFLLSNPFPLGSQVVPGLCVDQVAVKSEFVRMLREFYNDSQARRLTITGRTGAGKTNLLKFFAERFRAWSEPAPDRNAITDLFDIYVHEPQVGYLEVHRQIVIQLGARFYAQFFDVVRSGRLNLNDLPVDLPGISPEFVRVLNQVASRSNVFQQSFLPAMSELIRPFDSWMQGIKLTPTEKKYLGGVSTEIGNSTTVAIRFLSDLIRVFRHARLFRGLVILFDEFEEVFSGRSGTDQARYAQDLRNLFDSVTEGVMFVIATVPIDPKLEQISPALFRRLGRGVDIEPIKDETSALDYASAYIDHGRKMFQEQMKREVELPQDVPVEDEPFYPLSRNIVIQVYERLQATRDVVPGDFLPELNLRLYQHVYGIS